MKKLLWGLALLFAGHVFAADLATIHQAAKNFKFGETTDVEVVKTLGVPTLAKQATNGASILVYECDTPLPSETTNAKKVRRDMVIFLFDKNGKLAVAGIEEDQYYIQKLQKQSQDKK